MAPMPDPVVSGDITEEGVLALLAQIERRRTTGVLRFEAGETSGEVTLLAGQLALEQGELPDGRDPVEALLGLRTGCYELFQRLPPLPVSKGDDQRREGSLAVHVPADLMNYCERAGFTGTLTFEREEREAQAVYDRGELIAIRVDGTEDDDLHDVFGWEQGSFEILAYAAAPSLRPEELEEGEPEEDDPSEREPTLPRIRTRRDETGQQFLSVVEVALTTILEEREKRRSPSRTSPPMPPARKARRPDSVPGLAEREQEPRRGRSRREPTVKVIYLRPKTLPPPGSSDTRHSATDVPGDEVLTEAAPERRDGGREPGAAGADVSGGLGAAAVTLGWLGFAFLVFAAALALLARLPPIE